MEGEGIIRQTDGAKFKGPIEAAEGGYRPDLDGVISTLQRYARAPFPVRFMGFPSYT